MSVWQALSVPKRIFLVVAVGATIFLFSTLARTVSQPGMALLYSGLESDVAGDVITSLEQMGVKTEVRGNSIYVPENRRDSLRMALARDGLPNQGQAGFELLKDLNGFSTTTDMFNVTYWRAIEGELARTITATPGVRSARVHISYQRSGAFSRNNAQPKAAVTVTMGANALNPSQANSIRYLVAAAVPGMSAEQVAVIDSDRGVVLSPGQADSAQGMASDGVDRERRIENDVLDLLEARVGPGNVRVQVALEIDTEREAVTERVFDPEGRVMSGKETTEISEKSSGASGGAITVASNLPEGDGQAGSGNSSNERTQTDEVVKYDLSEIRREREKAPGSVKRMSIAVLVNHMEEATADGAPALTPRTDEEIQAIRDLVAMASGFDESRGDTLTVQSLAFKPFSSEGSFVEPSFVSSFLDRHLMTVIQIAVLSIVTLILGLFVVKPLVSVQPAPPAAEPSFEPEMATAAPVELVPEQQDPVAALRDLATDRTDETATLIKTWLEEEEEAA